MSLPFYSYKTQHSALPYLSNYKTRACKIISQKPISQPKFTSQSLIIHHQSIITTSEFVDSNPIVDCVQNGATIYAMRHRKRVKKLGKPADQRKALIRSLVTELLRHGKIKTTKVRAKAIRPYVDKMINLAKRGDLHARRQALAFIYDKEIVKSVFDKASERYPDRNSGYTRIIKELKLRRGDAAEMANIELV